MIDSLNYEIARATHDTTRLNILFVLTESIFDANVWPLYNEKAYHLSEKLLLSKNESVSRKGKKGLADALNNFGVVQKELGEIKKAMEFYNKSLALYQELNDKKGITYSFLNLGILHDSQGDVASALELWNKTLKLSAETGDKNVRAEALNNIGYAYNKQGNVAEALMYYEKSLKLNEEIKDDVGIALALNNMGAIFEVQGDFAAALDYYNRSLKIRQRVGDKDGIATAFNNIGALHARRLETDSALEYYFKSLKIYERIGQKEGMANEYNNIGGIFFKKSNYTEALDHYSKSLSLYKGIGDKGGSSNTFQNKAAIYIWLASLKKFSADRQKNIRLAAAYADSSLILTKELGFPEYRRNSEFMVARIDSVSGDYAGAFEHYKQYIIYRDSISNDQTRKASVRNQLKYEFEKKEAVIKEQQEKERTLAAEKDRRQKILIWAVAGGLILVIGFAGFVFRSLKTTRHQKEIIEEKQKEILDSIRYAKRIQHSLLPTEKYISNVFRKLKANK